MKTVLVVDDEEILLKTLQKKLEETGYAVMTARNGADALAIIKTSNVDLILLDLVMPGLHGTEVVTEISKIRPNIPVIILTNVNTGSYQDGVKEYLVKSESSLDDIVKSVNRNLGLISQ